MTTKTYSILGALVAVLVAAGAQAQQVTTVTATNLLEPTSITVDPNNNIYFTDASDNRIVKFIPTTNAVSTLAGVSGPGFSGTNNGFGAAARFSQPLGIVYDPYRGGLVVVDQGNQVLRFVTLDGTVSNLAGVEATMLNPSGGFVDGPAAKAQFSYPVGIATDGQNLYIADAGNNAIRRLDTNNNVATIKVTNYTFYSPEALVVDNSGNLWIADTRNDTICVISNISVITNQTVTVVAGTIRQSGTNDSALASAALFDQPCGLLWDPYGAGLFISDTGNNTIRRLYLNGAGYSVQTLAGIPGVAGYVDGALGTARFNGPVGMAVDTINNGYYVVDRGNNALRRLQTSPPQAPITPPVIGYVTFSVLNGQPVSQFNPTTDATFNNPAIIAIEAEPAVQTFMTYGPTPPSPFLNTIPAPGPSSGNSPQLYAGDGLPAAQTVPSVLAPQPDVTMYAISEALGRTPSAVVSSRFRFVTANPGINGNNAASVQLTDNTTNAAMYYTLDGSMPTNDGSNGLGPVTSGQSISFVANSNVTLTVKAFTPNFSPSGASIQVFNASNYVANAISFGFANGEASSRFVGSAGRLFYAPITMSILPGTTAYDLQFNVTVVPTNTLGGPAPAQPANYTFNSMLVNKQTIQGVTVYVTIPPSEYEFTGFQSLLFTNSSENLLGVGWLEVDGSTNLYFNDIGDDLIAFSIAHETIFTEAGGKIVVGGYSFFIPASATNAGDAYQIQIGRPSAATQLGSFAPTLSVDVEPPTNGVLGAGAINSIKRVTTGINPYLVGDVYPFGWFNAGDFGSTNLQSADVVEVFRAAVYDNVRNLAGSDLFNALDSSDGSDNGLYNENDTAINNVIFGDNALNVDDVYVTYRRSLDPALTWYERLWVNGTQYAQPVPNTGTAKTTLTPVLSVKAVANPASATAFARPITVAAARATAAASQTVQVPIQVSSADSNYPVRVMALNVEVIPLDGSPAITNSVTITPAAGLGAPTLTDSQGKNNYAAAWLGSTNAGVSGTNILGSVSITLPPGVTTNSSYLVHFEHFSASPNGLALFHPTIKDGLVTVGGDRSVSSWGDGIPDWWRLTYFGTVSNVLSAANLDPDNDGASNWQEYVAGTNPQDTTSALQVTPSSNFMVQWPSETGKAYTLESSTSLFSTNWTVLCTNMVGTGKTMQIQDTNLPAPPARFYRVVVQ